MIKPNEGAKYYIEAWIDQEIQYFLGRKRDGVTKFKVKKFHVNWRCEALYGLNNSIFFVRLTRKFMDMIIHLQTYGIDQI